MKNSDYFDIDLADGGHTRLEAWSEPSPELVREFLGRGYDYVLSMNGGPMYTLHEGHACRIENRRTWRTLWRKERVYVRLP